MSAFIEFADVTKAYGAKENVQLALNKVSFEILAGEFVVILGQSGAGKTTLLNLLGGMDTLSDGNIFVNGTGLYGMSDSAYPLPARFVKIPRCYSVTNRQARSTPLRK